MLYRESWQAKFKLELISTKSELERQNITVHEDMELANFYLFVTQLKFHIFHKLF